MILEAGLTGGIASGKSTVARILAALGCVVIDADAIVARLYRPGEAGHEALVREYGREILLDDGTINRRKLAEIAFATDKSTRRLNALIHPLVIEEERRLITAETERFPDRDRIFVVEATLLLESGGKARYDRIIVVDAEPDTQIARAVARGMIRDEVVRRMARQISRDERLQQADYVIDNGADPRTTEIETRRVYEKLSADLQNKKNTNR